MKAKFIEIGTIFLNETLIIGAKKEKKYVNSCQSPYEFYLDVLVTSAKGIEKVRVEFGYDEKERDVQYGLLLIYLKASSHD